MVNAADSGWTAPWTLVPLVAGVVMAVAGCAVEARPWRGPAEAARAVVVAFPRATQYKEAAGDQDPVCHH
ncbi:hypothetical protein AB5J52_44640 [Streptomyces sp. R39]|uniref:Lipoprotein n=1 Tax=Streptomyces sp. R39 TaxID=3238631 RepID=A0AB39R2J9_9ACTN